MKTARHALVLAVVLSALSAHAKDWFVRAGASGGDGSQSKPFTDPWQALDKCEAGDAIHIAAGKYTGRAGNGTWELPFDNVQLLGGYDADFKERNPWKNQTQLWWDPTSKNRPKQERLLSNKRGNLIDGLIIDQRDQCRYEDEKQSGRIETPCDTAMRFSLPVTVRNCVVVNPGFDGIVAPTGSTLENNLVINAVNWGIAINGTSDKQAVATLKNNSVLFTFSFKEPGKGAYNGSGIALKGSANVTANIIGFSDSNGIYLTVNPEKTTLDGNVFFMNLWANLKFYVEGRDTPIDDKSMDELDEVGLKSVSGNEVKNPKLPVDPKWMDAVSKRTAATPGKLVMDDFNQARKLLGLDLIAKGGTPPSGVAPAMNLDDALKLMAPANAGKAGARVVPLTVTFQGAGAAAVVRDYRVTEPKTWARDPSSVDGKPLEMIVGISSVANIGGVPAQYKKDEHEGVKLHQPDGNFEMLTGFYKKGSSVDRTASAAVGSWNGSSGKPDRLFRAKGLAYATTWVPKGAFYIESLEEVMEAGPSRAATAGRDWFVRAGAAGGDGSKGKPFKDPWQALEKCESGDFIHVAEGEYFGKLKAGQWKIDNTNISLVGGYDPDFKERNPWKHPTRLYSPPEYKGRRGGYTIEGEDDHTGAIIDGFVFDKKTNNLYSPDGDLDYSRSDKAEHIWLAKNGCIIRNNVFLNGAEGAVRAQSGQTFENNIFINHYQRAVKVDRAFDGPFIFRNNTVLFAWEFRFGEGHGRGGTLLTLGGQVRGIVDNNIFEFSDNDAVWVNGLPTDFEFTNNVFSHNLYSHVTRKGGADLVFDDKNFGQLTDLKFKKLEGNVLASSGVPLDQKWFDVYLGRTAYTPGKVQMDEWNQLREMMGQPVIATGGKPGGGLAPAYPWQKALQLFPKNPKVTAGAKMKDLPVTFTGVDRKEETFEYSEVTWADAAKDRPNWDKLDGKRVAMKVVIRSTDNQYYLDDLKKDDFLAFTVTGPEGNDSGGLPVRGYVKKGGKAERAVRQAKSYSSGTPDQWYVIKGVARTNKQLLVEVVERAD